MSSNAVGNDGFEGSAQNILSEYRTEFVTAIRASKLKGALAGKQIGTGNYGGESIEDVVLCFFRDFIGERMLGGFPHVCAERVHDGAGALRRLCLVSRGQSPRRS